MPVKREIPYSQGLYFITFTCYKWLPLIKETNGYDLIYQWFDYLQTKSHRIAGYVIMPNHVHALIDFASSEKSINKIVGDGKRFIAYDIIKRLKANNDSETINTLQKAVASEAGHRGKKHEVWEQSFEWKFCETADFAYQKLLYMHNNPCTGKWRLAADAMVYEHSSARFYISGRHAAYEITDADMILNEPHRPSGNKLDICED